jgi:hypothetical protein
MYVAYRTDTEYQMTHRPIAFPARFRTRAARIPGGTELLDIATRDVVIAEMARWIVAGAKPVLALTDPLIAELGETAARHDPLRQLAGEVTAWIAEHELGAIRVSSGVTRQIHGDRVFTSATHFVFSPVINTAVDPVTSAVRALARRLRDALTESERAIFARVFAEPVGSSPEPA